MKAIATKKIFTRSENLYLLLFVLYIPLIFFGFGTDSDTYTVINAWSKFLATHDYLPSRLPGYVIHEFSTFLLTRVGGSWLSNLVTLLFAAGICFIYLKIAKKFEIPGVSVLLLIFNPVFIVSATSTVDYLWALFFFLTGFYFLSKGKIIEASLLLGVSSAIRLTYGLLVLGMFIFYFVKYIKGNPRLIWRFLLGGIAILVINFAAYYLPMDFTEWKPSVYFRVSIGDASMWSSIMRIGRWGYKNLLLWGIPSVFVVLTFALSKIRSFRRIGNESQRGMIWISAILILLVEGIFLLFPIEIEYLLPLLPFSVLTLGFLLREKKWVLIFLSILILVNGFFAVNIAQPDTPNHATRAVLGITSAKGYLLQDIEKRVPYLFCDFGTSDCYLKPE